MKSSSKGIILGITAAVSYGTNPLFAVPLYEAGLTVMSVLFYRYAFATLILGIIMWLRRDTFRIHRGELALLVILGILFALSSVFLFASYKYMDVGIASTMLFVEPVFIALLLWLIYHERVSMLTMLAIAICGVGIACLSNPGEGAVVTATGVVLVISSSVAYAIYMVIINKSRIGRISGTRITFYSLLFGQIVFAACTHCFLDVQPLPYHSPQAMICVAGLSVVPTIISLLTVAIAIKHVGSVTVAILGALEPVTGILVGTLVFNEILTPKAILGIFLILASVLVIIAKPASR